MTESFSGSGYIFPQVKMSCEWILQSMAPPKTESRLISNPKKQTKQLNQPCNVPQTCKDVQENLRVIFPCKYQISWNDFLASTVIYFSHNQVQNITCHTLLTIHNKRAHQTIKMSVCMCVCVSMCTTNSNKWTLSKAWTDFLCALYKIYHEFFGICKWYIMLDYN